MSKKFLPAVIVSIFLINILAAAEPGPSKEIPELAPLSNWAGAWTGHVEKPTKRSGPSEGKWIVDGRYLQQTWKLPADADNPAISGTWIMTYDVNRKIYRQWQFNSDGFTGEATGQWDAATRTMTWTTRDSANGTTTVNKDHFATADLQRWSIVIADRDGKTVFEMSGSNTRKKE